MQAKYYDGTKLLSMKDLNGNTPEIFMCTSNRTGGKSTYFGRLLVNRFLKHGEKFGLLYRFNYELKDVPDKFFKVLSELFFPEHVMTSKSRADGIYHELFIDEVPCGYAISINSADKIKTLSGLFSDISRMLFDEFQSESNHYCSEEVKKFISVHTSVARGNKKQVRYVPVYMLANPVTTINPYYVEMGISGRLQENTKFLRGEGFVLEQGYNETACLAQKESGFNRAFKSNEYVAYSSESVYLNDNKSFIEKMTGDNIYLCTFKYNNNEYALREYTSQGIIYCDDKPDTTFRTKISITTDDHEINYVMLKRNDMFLSILRNLFEKGCFRFKNLTCKEVVLKALSY